MNPRDHLHLPQNLIDRVLQRQQRLFGHLLFGPLYVVFTLWWVKEAQSLGLDNPGLTIYTFLVSVLSIYMSWVVTNILNRTSARDKRRDDLEAEEVSQAVEMMAVLNTVNARQLEILEALHQRSSGDSQK